MKVLFFIGEFNEGGAERVISIISNNMIEKGFDVEILKYHNTENLYDTNPKIKINSVEENTHTRKNIIKNVLWLRKYFKENADIIVSFLAPFNMLSIFANLDNNIPIIVADRNDPRFTPSSSILRKIRNILYNKANGIVLQTKHNQEYFSNNIKNKSVIIENPINIKDKVGLALNTNKEKLIVSVGRLEPQKNQTMLIEAFNELLNKYKDYKLVIYGEGSYRNNLQELINSLFLQDKVLLPGNEKDILNKIAKAEVFVLPSNYEGMSNALLEAMSIGLPVISTKVSGSNEIIEDGVNGILVDVNNKKQLIDKLDSLLSNKVSRQSLGNKASEIAYKLDNVTISNKWIDFISKYTK